VEPCRGLGCQAEWQRLLFGFCGLAIFAVVLVSLQQ
jgi:hypothetical protein